VSPHSTPAAARAYFPIMARSSKVRKRHQQRSNTDARAALKT
jgi:hypothetical protein